MRLRRPSLRLPGAMVLIGAPVDLRGTRWDAPPFKGFDAYM
jgi:hypothetical protein